MTIQVSLTSIGTNGKKYNWRSSEIGLILTGLTISVNTNQSQVTYVDTSGRLAVSVNATAGYLITYTLSGNLTNINVVSANTFKHMHSY